ncbi:MAG: type II toxin-antitoxin system HicA family toxin [Candidatus Kapaibacterium sp.]
MSEKLPRVTASDLIRVLKKIGFIEDRSKGSHKIFIHPSKHLRAVIPFHKGRNLAIGTLKSILDDAEISVEQLRELL